MTFRTGIIIALLLFQVAANYGVSCAQSQDVTVTLTQMADFQVTTTPDPANVNITLLNLNQDTNYTDGKYSVAHNSANEKKILAQVTGGSAATGIILKAWLEAPAVGDAEAKGPLEILDGTAVYPGARTLVEKLPPGFFDNLALHYTASANFSAAVGANSFTVTFTISE